MKTVATISILGLDPKVWDSFRALLIRDNLSVSAWATKTIKAYVESAKVSADV